VSTGSISSLSCHSFTTIAEYGKLLFICNAREKYTLQTHIHPTSEIETRFSSSSSMTTSHHHHRRRVCEYLLIKLDTKSAFNNAKLKTSPAVKVIRLFINISSL
jgi:hypothetical protein